MGGGKCKEAVSSAAGNTEEYATLGPTGFIKWNRINTTTNISQILRENMLIIQVVSSK